MISYEPLWQTMKRHGATTYTLQAKAGISPPDAGERIRLYQYPGYALQVFQL